MAFPTALPSSLGSIHDVGDVGVILKGRGTKGRLESCEITGTKLAGVQVSGGAAPLLLALKISKVHGAGVIFVEAGTGGRLEGSDIWGNKNAGVQISEGSNPLISACKLWGGLSTGFSIEGDGTKGRLEGCCIWGNSSAGVQISGGADPALVSLRIFGGNNPGLLVGEDGTRGRLESCELWGNERAQVLIGTGSDPTLIGNRIRGDFRGERAPHAVPGHLEVYSLDRFGAGKSAGVTLRDCGTKGTLVRNTIFGHAIGGIIVIEGATPSILSNKVYGCGGNVTYAGPGAGGRLAHNAIYGSSEAGVGISRGAEPLVDSNLIYGNTQVSADGSLPVLCPPPTFSSTIPPVLILSIFTSFFSRLVAPPNRRRAPLCNDGVRLKMFFIQIGTSGLKPVGLHT